MSSRNILRLVSFINKVSDLSDFAKKFIPRIKYRLNSQSLTKEN